ncbi:hypothetical protein BDZ89DRAFT_1069633 [Hymenopellis radicata]|nr:hypothetical protein BDZ89DRAFT_1069633 [Hymenopellis radicata]
MQTVLVEDEHKGFTDLGTMINSTSGTGVRYKNGRRGTREEYSLERLKSRGCHQKSSESVLKVLVLLDL